MIKQPAHLKKGDKIAVTCPASRLPKNIDKALSVFKEWGLEVVTGGTANNMHHQFSGTDAQRSADLQRFLDDPSIKAIIAGRGGYGTIRIIDQLDFSTFAQNPKWIVGFSDITVLLSHIYAVYGIRSIHGPMPNTFDEATPQSLESLRRALFGEPIDYGYHPQTRPDNPAFAEKLRIEPGAVLSDAIVIGGNLTLLVMVEGSPSAMDYTDKILFIEDVAERPASIDRMMRMLDRTGKLAKLKGLIVGAFNELPEEKIPFGQTPEEIIREVVKKYGYPVWFNFPAGHIDDNRALVVGGPLDLL